MTMTTAAPLLLSSWLRLLSIIPLLQLMLLLLLPVDVDSKSEVDTNLVFILRGQVPEFRPEAVIDIGANKGKYSAFVHRMYPEASILLLEADEKHEAKLENFCREKRPAIDYRIALLSASENDSASWFGGGDTGNSMFRERSEVYDRDRPVSKLTQTLDRVVATSHIANKRVDLIKVDVQGAELLVLQGGTNTLRQATFVQVEASTIQFNDGGSCTWQVDEFLRSQGYAVYDMGDKRYYMPLFKTPGLGQYDLMYINTNKLPEKLQEAKFCNGTSTSSGDYFQESMVELENMVGIQQETSCKRGSGGILLTVGLVAGYLLCTIQNRLFRFRRLRRED